MEEADISRVDRVLCYLEGKPWFDKFERLRLLDHATTGLRKWLDMEDGQGELANIIRNAFIWSVGDDGESFWEDVDRGYQEWYRKELGPFPNEIRSRLESSFRGFRDTVDDRFREYTQFTIDMFDRIYDDMVNDSADYMVYGSLFGWKWTLSNVLDICREDLVDYGFIKDMLEAVDDAMESVGGLKR